MFWPKYRTLGSRCISWWIPASIAAMKGMFAMGCSGLGVDVVERGLELGERALDAERHGRVHFLRHLHSELVRFRGAQYAALHQDTAKTRHWIAAQRRFVFLALAEHSDRLVLGIMERHSWRGDDVAVRRETIDLRLDQRWSFAGACPLHRLTHRHIHSERVGTVDRHPRHRERFGVRCERRAVRGVRGVVCRGGHDDVAIVRQHADRRQLPRGSDVERFEEGTLFRCAIAEEAEDYFTHLANLRRPGRPRRMRNTRADDARSAEEAALHIGEVHGPAEPFAQPVRATVAFGHHRFGVAAESDGIAVTAVGGEGCIAAAEVRKGADDRGFGTIRQVSVPADDARVFGEGTLDALFELADTQHLGEDPDLTLGVGYLYAHWISRRGAKIIGNRARPMQSDRSEIH